MKMKSPYYTQKTAREKNRNRILGSLLRGPKTFTQLASELDLSKPVLSSHLKELRKEGIITKRIENDQVVYALTEKSFELPSLRILSFEISVYHQMMRELFKPNEPIRITQGEKKLGKESLLYWDLDPEYLEAKSEADLIHAFNQWLTPVVLYAILQEVKSGNKIKWTEAVSGIIEKLSSVIKQKDTGKFEEAFKTAYSKSLVESLDAMVELIERRKQVDEHFSNIFEKLEK